MVRPRNNNLKKSRNNGVANRRNRRAARHRVRKHPRSSHISTSKGIRIPTHRELRTYVKPIGSENQPATSWLDSLIGYGLFAMKLFVVALTEQPTLTAVKAYPTSSTQGILIGIDECLKSHPMTQLASTGFPVFPFTLASINTLSITIKAGAKLSERAGRLAAVLIEISREEATDLLNARRKQGVMAWKSDVSYQYDDIIQTPGATSVGMNNTIVLRWRPSGTSFARQHLEVGQKEVTGNDLSTHSLPGGLPFLRLLVGYSDFASDSGSVKELYGAEEAEFSINIDSSVSVSQPGTAYIRRDPPTLLPTDGLGVATPNSMGKQVFDIPHEKFYLNNDGLFLSVQALAEARLQSMEI